MKQVAVGGHIYSYQEFGVGRRTPLLILHGWGRNSGEWEPIAGLLASGSRKVYALDLPGFGGSSSVPVHSLQEYTELVVQFCQYLGLLRVIVVGHSLGGRVGILLAVAHPQLVEKLVLIAPAGIKSRSVRRSLVRVTAQIFSWVPRAWRRRLTLNLMDEDYRNSPALRDLYRVVVAEDLRKYLPQITCHTDIIWGELDPILPLIQTRMYRKFLRDRRVHVVWGAQHDPHLSHPDQLLSIFQEVIE